MLAAEGTRGKAYFLSLHRLILFSPWINEQSEFVKAKVNWLLAYQHVHPPLFFESALLSFLGSLDLIEPLAKVFGSVGSVSRADTGLNEAESC